MTGVVATIKVSLDTRLHHLRAYEDAGSDNQNSVLYTEVGVYIGTSIAVIIQVNDYTKQLNVASNVVCQ